MFFELFWGDNIVGVWLNIFIDIFYVYNVLVGYFVLGYIWMLVYDWVIGKKLSL